MSTYSDLIGGSAGSATTVYAALADLPLSDVVAGAQAYVSATNRLYLWSGAGWYNIALINTAPTITTGGDSSYALASDGTATVVTLDANDPEGIPITWSYAVTTGALGSTATVSQNNNVFTITPSTVEANAGGFTLTFTASDGVNIATSASEFSLSFVPDWAAATQQAKIQASDKQASDEFGHSVALSGDGSTAIVGAIEEDTGGSNAGAAYIFTRSGSTWTEQAKIQASDKAAPAVFGWSVALSSDGNTAVVGARRHNPVGYDAGAAYIFTRSGSTWTEQAKIESSDIEAGDQFGFSVSLSSDGNTAVVGSKSEGTGGLENAGAAYIFTRSGSTWTEQAKIQSSDIATYNFFGSSVSISGDGNTLIAGAYGQSTGGGNAGAAYIFTLSGSTWSQQAKIQASDKASTDSFGASVSISGDGNAVIVGAKYEDTPETNIGASYIFTRSGSTWTEQAKLQASDGAESHHFGESVSMSNDGNVVIVGANYEDDDAYGTYRDTGAAYIFTRSGSTWTEQSKLEASDAERDDEFGISVSLSRDGGTVIVGAKFEDTGGTSAGAAYILVAG